MKKLLGLYAVLILMVMLFVFGLVKYTEAGGVESGLDKEGLTGLAIIIPSFIALIVILRRIFKEHNKKFEDINKFDI